jgi:hypothetical protein
MCENELCGGRAEACPDDGLARPFGDTDSDVATDVLLNSLERIDLRTIQRVVHMNKIIGDNLNCRTNPCSGMHQCSFITYVRDGRPTFPLR